MYNMSLVLAKSFQSKSGKKNNKEHSNDFSPILILHNLAPLNKTLLHGNLPVTIQIAEKIFTIND